jgi:predicted nucleic acid-binding protein
VRVAYLDSSALVKLVLREPETAALRRFLRKRPDVAVSGLARTEVPPAAKPHGPGAVRRARALLRRVNLVRVDDAVLDAAALLEPAPLRSLDAIHLASAMTLADDLEVVITYDGRTAKAGEALGLPVVAPR